jgi:predicted ATPase/DNA-binding SARP family transcriptional activator
LGSFSVWAGGEKIDNEPWRSRRARSLVKLLALAEGHRMHRDQAAEMLWPDADRAASANNFHQTLFTARQALEPGKAVCLRLEDGFISLSDGSGQPPWVDVEQFEAAAQAAKDGSDPAACQAALDLYAGDLLPEDRYAEWTQQPREHLRQVYRDLLACQAQWFEARRDDTRAIEAYNRLISVDRLNEDAHTGLMRLYALCGKKAQAMRQYQMLREALYAELNVEPAGLITTLYHDIQAGRFPPEAASAVSDADHPQPGKLNRALPVPLTSFIGREAEIAAVCQKLQKNRLVTLTGAGGVGKTRLALQAAERIQPVFKHGVGWVRLAPLSDPALVPLTVATHLGLHEQTGQDLRHVLQGWLEPRSLLLVLDNCEHVLSEVADLVMQLLPACPHLHILVTSRELLHVEGEMAFRCPSLQLPPRQTLPLAGIAQSEAVRLFVERAGAVSPGFALTDANAAQVLQICRQLDGIPLAIELAAARTRMLGVEQIAARLEDSFHLLRDESRGKLSRHQTLHASIEWSFHLLPPQERLLLQRLAIFSGGWSLEAAEQVADISSGSAAGAANAGAANAGAESADAGKSSIPTDQVIDLLGQLVDKSLILFNPNADGFPRYLMLETIRQFARSELAESGEEDAIRTRHLAHFLALSQQACPHLRAVQARTWLNRLELELNNLRQALAWAVQGPLRAVEQGLWLAGRLLWFWWGRDHGLEGLVWIERLVKAQAERCLPGQMDHDSLAARGKAMNAFSQIVYSGGALFSDAIVELNKQYLREARAIYEVIGADYPVEDALSGYNQAFSVEETLACRSRFQALHDDFWLAQCDQALTDFLRPDFESSTCYGEEGLALTRAIGDTDGEGGLLYMLAKTDFFHGDLEQAAEQMSAAVSLLEKVGNQFFSGWGRNTLVTIAAVQGDLAEANRQNEILFALAQDLNDANLHRLALCNRATLAWVSGDASLAIRCEEEALAQARELPPIDVFPIRVLLARIAVSQGKAARARYALKDAAWPDGYLAWPGIHTVGLLCVLEQQMKQAATVFGAQSASARWLPNLFTALEQEEYKQALAAVHAALPEAAFQRAWNAGQRLSLAEITAFVQKIMAPSG